MCEILSTLCIWAVRDGSALSDVAALTVLAEMAIATPVVANASSKGLRAIPIAMRSQFVKKSRGRLTARADCIDVPERGADPFEASCTVVDRSGDVCAKFWISFSVSRARSRHD
jgi:hypothetical protein